MLEVGDVLVMPVDTIHSVANETNEMTLTLHVYGKHLQYSARSQFDLEQNSESPRRTVWRDA